MNKSEKVERSNCWVLADFSVIALMVANFSAYTDRIGVRKPDGNRIHWVGVVVCAAGGIPRIIPVRRRKNRSSGLEAI